MSIKISIISSPQSPKVEFFHSFRGVRGNLKHFGCPPEAGNFLRARSRKKPMALEEHAEAYKHQQQGKNPMDPQGACLGSYIRPPFR